MIDAIKELHYWMKRKGICLADVEVTIRFPEPNRRNHFVHELMRDLSNFTFTKEYANGVRELKLFGMKVHLR